MTAHVPSPSTDDTHIPLQILDSVDSTNAYLRRNYPTPANSCAVMAMQQTAGRGQRGNVWCSDNGENILMSLLWLPHDIPPREIFSISEATALAVCDILWREAGIMAQIKWPNDIYIDNQKICGILIENALGASYVTSSVIGIGLNVNQHNFDPAIPNPVSIIHYTDDRHDITTLTHALLSTLQQRLRSIETPSGRLQLHTEYMERMWRNDHKPHTFVDTATGEQFQAIINDVEPQGYLLLHRPDRFELLKYAFKEVSFILQE